jgi:Raf kinase inhibitor-like YbhB/YbcL family protein
MSDRGRCPHCGFVSDSDRGEFYDPTYPCPRCNKGGARIRAGYGRLRGDEPGVVSPEFKSGDTMPKDFTADGKNISPPLQWGVPEETAEIAIIMDDPDVEANEPWVHWVAYGIPGTKTGLKAGADVPKVGANSWGETKYRGPEPPAGKPHKYWIKVYALDAPLQLEPGATKKALLKAIEGHVIDRDAIVVFYSRDKKEGAEFVKSLLSESLPLCHELLDRRGGYRS